MAQKTLGERRAEKIAQMEALKKELVALEAKAGERIGKLAIRAGLADLNLDDETMVKEFQAIASRFRGYRKEQDQAAAPSTDQVGTHPEPNSHG